MQIKLKSKSYPDLLKEIDDPPKQLFFQGDEALLERNCIAIVGTRKNSDYGHMLTEKIISELSHTNFVIVSGLAYGIDTIAHKAALKNNMPTIAVLASGISPIYPKANQQLAQEILENGLIISENPNNSPTLKHQFLRRNRIISGISLLTLIVEAPEKSGALNTACHALQQGREIATIPADIDRQSCWGNLKLLQAGSAHPISCGQDIISILQKQPGIFSTLSKQDTYKLSHSERLVLDKLSASKVISLDQLSSICQKPIQEILITLSMLEVYGLVKTLNGKYLATSNY